MASAVTERFIESLNYLKQKGTIPSSRQFALKLNVHPQCISDIIKGKREVTIEMLRKAIDLFDLDATYMMTGQGNILNNDHSVQGEGAKILTVAVDSDNNERIVYVPVSAQAGYGRQIQDPVFFSTLPTFTLPDHRFSHGTYRCFDISGDSMEPTLFTGDQVVCSFVEPEDYVTSIRDNFVYVVVTKCGIVVKRVINNLKTDHSLLLQSDNSYYDPYEIPLENIHEIWLVKVKISPFVPSPKNMRNALHHEVDDLRATIRDQSQVIQNLNSTIEKLLKQSRSVRI